MSEQNISIVQSKLKPSHIINYITIHNMFKNFIQNVEFEKKSGHELSIDVLKEFLFSLNYPFGYEFMNEEIFNKTLNNSIKKSENKQIEGMSMNDIIIMSMLIEISDSMVELIFQFNYIYICADIFDEINIISEDKIPLLITRINDFICMLKNTYLLNTNKIQQNYSKLNLIENKIITKINKYILVCNNNDDNIDDIKEQIYCLFYNFLMNDVLLKELFIF